jgi:hypothetical protein
MSTASKRARERVVGPERIDNKCRVASRSRRVSVHLPRLASPERPSPSARDMNGRPKGPGLEGIVRRVRQVGRVDAPLMPRRSVAIMHSPIGRMSWGAVRGKRRMEREEK